MYGSLMRSRAIFLVGVILILATGCTKTVYVASTDAPTTNTPSTDAPSTDAGGNTQARLSDEEFCAKVDEMSGVMYAEGRVFSDLLNRLRELAKVTRDAELQEALETFIPLVEEMSKLDQDDRDMSTLSSMLVDPNITDAGEFISNYAAENC